MSTARRLLVFPFALALLLVPAAALAQDAGTPRLEGPDLILLSGTASVPRGTTVGEVVVLRGRAEVAGVVLGDVVVLDGPIEVQGQVSGSVIAVNGRVALGPDAQIGGDVRARGRVDLAQGAKVGGVVRQHAAFTWRAPIDVFGRFAGWLAVSVSTLAFGLLLVLLAPRGLDAVTEVARTAPWTSAGWALALAVGLPVAVVLLGASLLGLPLALALLLGVGLLGLVGYVAAMFVIGRFLWGPPRNRALAFLFGWGIARAVGAIPYVSGITATLAALFGLGVGLVATWRARAAGGKHREGKTVVLPEVMREEAGL
ncbi:MAG TPA: hypothetical protein VF984_11615 [Actinomycetota bacterium]